MEVHADRAAIFASRATNASAVIDDFGAHPAVLTIAGDIDTSGADTVRFLRESPLVNGPGAFTRAVAIEGPARLKLQLVVSALGRRSRPRDGRLQLRRRHGDSRQVARDARRARTPHVHRDAACARRRSRARSSTSPRRCRWQRSPMARCCRQIDGHIEPDAMAPCVPAPMLAKLTGGFDWKARLVSGKQGSELVVTSDLKGLARHCPCRSRRTAADARDATLTMSRLGARHGESRRSRSDGGAFGRFGRDADGRWNVALKFGTPVETEPVREGLWLYGQIALRGRGRVAGRLRRSAHGAKPRGDEEDAGTRAARHRHEARSRRTTSAASSARWARTSSATPSQWAGKLESPLVTGNVQWTTRRQGPPRGEARPAHRSRSRRPRAARSDTPQATDTDLPSLDVTAERFDFMGHWLGTLDLRAEPEGEDWRIDKLDIVNDHAKFLSTGRWRRAGADVAHDARSEARDRQPQRAAHAVRLRRLREARRRAPRGQASCGPGYPYEFALAKLAGKFKVRAHYGQFAKIDPGAGKLLALISLQIAAAARELRFPGRVQRGLRLRPHRRRREDRARRAPDGRLRDPGAVGLREDEGRGVAAGRDPEPHHADRPGGG